MKVVTIVNPKSGRGAGQRLSPSVQVYAEELGLDFEVQFTEHAGHATELAFMAAANGAEIVAACGGDGTIHEVLNGILGTKSDLAAIPLGTGNDLCRTLGFGTDWKSALDAIANNRTIPMDIGKIETDAGSRYFHNIAGCGFDVAVAEKINSGFKKLKGTAAYIAGVLSTFFSYRAIEMKIDVDGTSIESKVMLCAVANAISYGGAMKIAPMARIDDGLLDVVIVEETSLLEFLMTFPKVFKGTHLSHPKVKHLTAKRVTIEASTRSTLLADGEIYSSTPATFTILKGAISIIVPASFEATGG